MLKKLLAVALPCLAVMAVAPNQGNATNLAAVSAYSISASAASGCNDHACNNAANCVFVAGSNCSRTIILFGKLAFISCSDAPCE